MGLPNQGSGAVAASTAGALGLVLLPQLDSVLSRTLTICGLTLLGVIIALKIAVRYRQRRRSK